MSVHKGVLGGLLYQVYTCIVLTIVVYVIPSSANVNAVRLFMICTDIAMVLYLGYAVWFFIKTYPNKWKDLIFPG